MWVQKSHDGSRRCGGETPNTIRLTRGHLDDLDRIQCTEGVGISADGMERGQERVELLGRGVREGALGRH